MKKKVLYLRDGKGDGVWESARERNTAAEEERSLGEGCSWLGIVFAKLSAGCKCAWRSEGQD